MKSNSHASTRIPMWTMMVPLMVAGAKAAETVTFCGGQGEAFGENGSVNVLFAPPDLGGAVVVSATVDLMLEHPWIGDVTALLTHDSRTIALVNRPAFPNFPHGCGWDDLSVVLRDDAASYIGNTCVMQPPAVSGVFKPEQPLSTFAGTPANGLWALTLLDYGADDCGMIPAGGVCVHLTYESQDIAPSIVHGNASVGQTSPCSGFIDPARESSNGVNLNQGVSQVRIAFSDPVFAMGGGPVTAAGFVVTQTGPGAPPTVSAVDATANPVITVTLSRVITLRQWTTIRADVQNAAGTHIQNLGDLGPGVNESDRVDIGFLPADVNQSGNVNPLDLLAYKQGVNFGALPPAGCSDMLAHYLDIDRSGVINPLDLLAFKRLVNYISPATQSWSGVTMLNTRP